MGKIYDDRGNRMSPSFSAKNGFRYRFYVSSALLRGRKADVGSVGRVPAAEIERAVLAALRPQQKTGGFDKVTDLEIVERVIVARDQLFITLARPRSATDMEAMSEIRCPWQTNITDKAA